MPRRLECRTRRGCHFVAKIGRDSLRNESRLLGAFRRHLLHGCPNHQAKEVTV
jgi:hypothetical protein